MTNCPACGNAKKDGWYLCPGDWYKLQPVTRNRLSLRDRHAMARLGELYAQLCKEVPLSEITVSQ